MYEQLSTSVVMATYNGEKNILEQLDSLLSQTKKINEVLICDDCSTDNTVDIISSFIEKNNLSSTWHLKINEKNLGWRKNFFHLLNLASQDIIFTCDQDDIWHETKIEEMSSLFRNKKIQVLVTDYHVKN